MEIHCAGLTTCGVVEDGHAVRLDFVDQRGTEVSLQLPFEQTQAIAMTLPSLLTHALQALTGKASSRYVFALNRWTVEQSGDCNGLLLTLATDDGFQVSFGVPAEACRGLGLILAANGGRPRQQNGADDEMPVDAPIALN
jgi:hypothetical protein